MILINRINKRLLIAKILLIAATIFFLTNISADCTPERTVDNLPLDPEFHPQLGTYYYQVNWNRVNVGKARISIDLENDLYTIMVHAETNRKLDKIYKIRYKGESRISTEPLTPIKAKINEKVKSTKKETTIEFQKDGTIKSSEVKSKKGKPSKTTEREFQTENFTLDPFSATCLVRRLDWEVGMEEIFDVITGEDQYLLELKCIKQTTIEIAGTKRLAWEIVPELTKLDTEEQEKNDQKKDDMTIYVSADKAKEMLKIKVALKVGYFRIILEKFEPAL
ncbi:MAG: DUF3108 domain-containing protein [Desulfobacteraceae bacterium]|nr:DUF3108 domain-containing protein [Desulfobacteraceae bacterium]MBC2757553.1 DUF3108 domain-containing protein [Desulfobacteraceae bacterium]